MGGRCKVLFRLLDTLRKLPSLLLDIRRVPLRNCLLSTNPLCGGGHVQKEAKILPDLRYWVVGNPCLYRLNHTGIIARSSRPPPLPYVPSTPRRGTAHGLRFLPGAQFTAFTVVLVAVGKYPLVCVCPAIRRCIGYSSV